MEDDDPGEEEPDREEEAGFAREYRDTQQPNARDFCADFAYSAIYHSYSGAPTDVCATRLCRAADELSG